MRIAMISADARPVGAARRDGLSGPDVHVTELAAALAALGHDVRVYRSGAGPARRERTRPAAGVTTVDVPVGPPPGARSWDPLRYLNPFGLWLTAAWQDGWAPDVVHGHSWSGGVAALVAREGSQRPTVVTFHGLGVDQLRWYGSEHPAAAFTSRVERTVGRMADAVVALSRSDARGLRRLGINPKKLVVVPSGVDTISFAPIGQSWGRRPGVYRILAVGRLVDDNGFDDVVSALPELPDTEVVIVGRPPPPSRGLGQEAARLRAIAVNNVAHQRLRLAGGVPYADMPGWYRSADLLVCSPRYTSFGRAAIEAMACGVPVVAAAVGGLRDTVVDGVTGRLIPARCPRTLAATIRGLLADPQRRRDYGTAGVERVRRHFSWRDIAARLVDVYGRVGGQTVLPHLSAAA